MVPWLINFLLFICALRNLIHFVSQHNLDNSLSEPLLAKKYEKNQSELGQASFLGKLTFSWINPLLSLGYSKILALEDIPSLVPEDEAKSAYQKFAHEWDSLLRETNSNNTGNLVLRAIAKVYLKENIFIGICSFLRTISVVVSPLILYAFVNYANGNERNLNEGLSIVGCLVVTKLVESLSQRHWFFDSRRSGMRMRSALMVAVYQKQLKLSSLGRRRHSAGEIVNYIAVDAYRMGEFPWWFHSAWSFALQLFLAIGVLLWVVGLGALTGLVPLFICGLLNVPFAKMLQKCQSQFMIAQDERLRSTSEILNNMKIIKLQSWEEKFKNLIESLRENEFKWLAETQFGKAQGTLLYWMSPTIISSVVFLGCVIFGSAPLNASTIFTVLASLRSTGEPVRMIPEALSSLIQVKVSFDRLNAFLLDDELKNDELTRIPFQKSEKSVKIQAGNFSWDPEIIIPTLREVNLEIRWGQKVAICGPIGAGKSSLLYAVLGEIPKISGTDCVMAALEKKTVILVTHQVEFLSAVDKILVMEGGQITQSGSYVELLTAGTAFEQLVNAHRDSITVLGPSNDENQEESQKLDMVQPEASEGSNLSKENSEGEIAVKGLPGVQLTEEEETEMGDVGWKPFWDYLIVSKGLLLLCLGIVAQSGFVALQAAATYWLALGIQIPKLTSGILIGVYTAISTLSAVFVSLRSFSAAHLGLKASRAFFSGFTNAVFKAPMSFFDSTPVGRILTRASSDLSILDFDIPFSTIFVVSGATEILTTIGIMASVTWQVLIVAILAIVAAKYVQGYYQPSARELIRINGTTKAPVMNYAAETSLGVVTIRAFNMVDKFFENYLKLIDTDAGLFFYSNAAMEWLVLRIEVLQNLTLFTAAFLLVLLPKGFIAPGLVGLSLSYALSLTNIHIAMTRWYCYLSNYMISVERIKQFMHIPSEPPAMVEDKRPPSSWPSKGRIELQALKIRYRPNAPLVLKDINCIFKEGTRVGVVGRTGSGKTTLISALFRLVEPASGKILVDGLDICSIGLKDLRMRLSIIPQEPTLFRGSVRTNLDPLGLYSDDEIWKALEKCQLKATICSLPNLLDSSGKLVEYDEPSKLLETNSSFSKLVAEYWSSCRRNSHQDFNKYQ
ncbi:ABC transporter C family member 8-like isoform X1 [Fagus crenata]